jgi:tetratricopeptide (TPR) repeat protein
MIKDIGHLIPHFSELTSSARDAVRPHCLLVASWAIAFFLPWSSAVLSDETTTIRSNYSEQCTGRNIPPSERVEACAKAIDAGPRTRLELAQFYASRGDAQYATHALDQAMVDYQKAIELEPRYSRAYVGRGNVLRDRRQFDRAIAEYDHAAELDHDDAEAYLNRGRTWSAKGEHRKAVEDYGRAISLDPQNASIYYDRGSASLSLGEPSPALSDFNQAIGIDPNNALYFQSRGWAWFVARNIERALADLDKAIELNPRFAHAYFQRANVLSAASKLDRAIADFGEAIRLSPSAFYYYHRGLAFGKKQDHAHAVQDYDAAINLDAAAKGQDKTHVNCCFGRQNALFVVRALAHDAQRQFESAIADYTEAILLDPKDAGAFIGRGNSRFFLQDVDAAIADYTAAIGLDAKSAVAFFDRGNAWYSKREYDHAITDYSEAIRIDPTKVEFYVGVGNSWQKTGKNETAIEYFSKAIEVNPGYVKAYTDRADSRAAAGKVDDAIADYKQALHLAPDDVRGYSELGRLYSRQGKFVEAEAAFRRAIDVRERGGGTPDLQSVGDIESLAWILGNLGRFADAAGLYGRAIGIRERVQGSASPAVAIALAYFGNMQTAAGDYVEAEGAYERALSIIEDGKNKDDSSFAPIYFGFGNLQYFEQHYAKAEVAYQRALSIYERRSTINEVDVASTLVGLGNASWQAGKYAESAQRLERAASIYERTVGPNHPAMAVALESLAIAYRNLGKVAEVEGLLKRSIAIREKQLGADSPEVAHGLHTLADIERQLGRYRDAQGHYQRVLNIRERTEGPNHVNTAQTLQNLGDAYRGEGRYDDAKKAYEKALTIREKIGDRAGISLAGSLGRMGLIYRIEKNFERAEEFYNRALEIEERVLGKSHPELADLFDDLAILYGAEGKPYTALSYSRRASASILAHAAEEPFSFRRSGTYGGLIEQRSDYLMRHLSNLSKVAHIMLEPAGALGREAFGISQWAHHSAAAAALQQTSARFASGDSALALLMRESQDLSTFWRGRNEALTAALADERKGQEVERLRAELLGAEQRLAQITLQLDKDYPEYVSLAAPKPLNPEETQKLLAPGEALVFFLCTDTESFVFVVTRDVFEWKSIPLGNRALGQKVAAFRRGLDIDAVNRILDRATGVQDRKLFNLKLANDLYEGLLGDMDELIKDKSHLIIVPSGPLTALPFHLLTTEPPTEALPKEWSGYRDASWLIRRQAISVMPSLASLKMLRTTKQRYQRVKPMIGFGDPLFDRDDLRVAAAQPRSGDSVSRGAGADHERLAKLPRLPETADELKEVGERVGATVADIYLGADATESAVKRLPLAEYRVVYFATHGLIPGEIEGLDEPALALSSPVIPTEDDNGLLTASEVAQLKLNADWVVLSACNTIAGDKPDAEALSGLARAFFYAGAHALLVSHWPVDSQAAVRLTTTAFGKLEANPIMSQAEALREAMFIYMDDVSAPWHAYPALWGPFVVIGETPLTNAGGASKAAEK